jgi:hypothetical protein
VGNRKITIASMDDSTECLIDNELTYVIEVPYQSVTVIFHNENWWII